MYKDQWGYKLESDTGKFKVRTMTSFVAQSKLGQYNDIADN